jgi:hypothetical protein
VSSSSSHIFVGCRSLEKGVRVIDDKTRLRFRKHFGQQKANVRIRGVAAKHRRRSQVLRSAARFSPMSYGLMCPPGASTRSCMRGGCTCYRLRRAWLMMMSSMPLTLRALTGHVAQRALLLFRLRQFFCHGHQLLAQHLGVLHQRSPPLSILLQTVERNNLTPWCEARARSSERKHVTIDQTHVYIRIRYQPTACFLLAV